MKHLIKSIICILLRISTKILPLKEKKSLCTESCNVSPATWEVSRREWLRNGTLQLLSTNSKQSESHRTLIIATQL